MSVQVQSAGGTAAEELDLEMQTASAAVTVAATAAQAGRTRAVCQIMEGGAVSDDEK